jgi:hypothetical protein
MRPPPPSSLFATTPQPSITLAAVQKKYFLRQRYIYVCLLAAGGMLGGCANSDFGEVNQTLVTNGIHDWIGRGAPPPKAEPSKFEYTDDDRALRDNAYPLIEPPSDRQQWYSVAGEYGMIKFNPADRRKYSIACRWHSSSAALYV